MDHYKKEIESSKKPVTSVYIVGSHVQEFVETIFPKLTNKITIVTGNAVQAVPTSVLGSPENARRFLDDDRLVSAWVQNLDTEHPKAFPLPLGLDFHNLHMNKSGPWHEHEDVLSPNQQEQQIHAIAADSPPFEQRRPAVLSHFTVGTQPIERSQWQDYFKEQSFAETPEGMIERPTLWNMMAGAQFVASPPGAGMDCHRTWEALVLGSVPIVRHFAPMAAMFEDLPVWQIECLSEVTEESLQRKADEVSDRLSRSQYDFGKLTIGWWKERLIRHAAAS